MNKCVKALVAKGVGLDAPATDLDTLTSEELSDAAQLAPQLLREYARDHRLSEISALLDIIHHITQPSNDVNNESDSVSFPYRLAEMAFEALPLGDATTLWQYMETREKTWRERAKIPDSEASILRASRGLIDQLSPALNAKIVGRVLLYLARVFGPDQQARQNLDSKSNKEELFEVDLEAPDVSDEYVRFYSLQRDMRRIPELLDSLDNLFEELNVVADINQVPPISEQPPPVAQLGPAWDTSPAVFKYQKSDPKMWTTVCLQVLGVLNYLLRLSPENKRLISVAPNTQALPKHVLSSDEEKAVLDLHRRWVRLLGKTIKEGSSRQILLNRFQELDDLWWDWKLSGYHPFPTSMTISQDLETPSASISDMAKSPKIDSGSFPYDWGNEKAHKLILDAKDSSELKELSTMRNDADILREAESLEGGEREDAEWMAMRATRNGRSWDALVNKLKEEPEVDLPPIPVLGPRPKPTIKTSRPTAPKRPAFESGDNEHDDGRTKRHRVLDDSPDEIDTRSERDRMSLDHRAAVTLRPNSSSGGRTLAPY